ncbi:MAG TPA: sugar transferase [Chloroflexota bacterium]|nr:sugar transferase [Chloroflexota bacterium]HUM68413.1 sugar transferase [Chloroflexota bacterium]
MVGIAFLLAYFVRFYSALPLFEISIAPVYDYYRNISLFLNPMWVIVFWGFGLYNRRNLLGGTQEYSLIFKAISLGIMVVVIFSFLHVDFILARGWLLIAWLFTFLFVSFGRFWIRRIIYALRRRGYYLSPALIVGINEEGKLLGEQLVGWQTSGLHVLGYVDDHAKPGTAVYKQLQCLGDTQHLDHLIARYGIEELIIATSSMTRHEMLSIFKRYGLVSGLNLRLSSGLFEIITTGLEVKEMACTPLVRVQKVRMTGMDSVFKLMLDYAIIFSAMLAVLPLMLLIAVVIKLDSPGPIIYRRRVMGINGRQFDAYKFRTMHVNGDEILAQHPELQNELSENHKLKEDPRITRAGRFLRKASLDELPQLFNVLKRQMSLVGPRMISPSEMEKYNDWALNLLTVLPGITGLWQVSGRSDISYDERVRLDMYYIRNWTIWLDIQLLIQTIPALLKGRGAY